MGSLLKPGKRAAQASLTGFNYLRDNPNIGQAQTQGVQAGNALGQFLGLGQNLSPDQALSRFADPAFNFRLRTGEQAITGSNAARGLLNSGATLRALTQFGQDLGSEEFNRQRDTYLGLLSSLQGAGQSAAGAVGSAGSAGGANAAQYLASNPIANLAGNLLGRGVSALTGRFGF